MLSPRLSIAVLVLWSFVVQAEAAVAACGDSYPESFPCLPGGSAFDIEDDIAFGYRKTADTYALASATLLRRLTEAAEAAGWTVEHREEHPHPEKWMRAQRVFFRKSGKLVRISVSDVFGTTLLQVYEQIRDPDEARAPR